MLSRRMSHEDMSQEEWKNCYDQWFERMQKCIDQHGEYFEKQKAVYVSKIFVHIYNSRNINSAPRTKKIVMITVYHATLLPV